MICQDFRDRHAEYMDGVMDPLDAALWRDHAASCLECARYDRAMRQSVQLLRVLPEIEPSPDFYFRLQHRIYNLEDGIRASGRTSGVGAVVSLAIAGMLAFLAWSPLLMDQAITPSMAGAAGRATIADGRAAPVPQRPAEAARAEARGTPVPGPASATVQLAAEAEEEPGKGADAGAASVMPSLVAPSMRAEEVWWWDSPRPSALRRQIPGFPSIQVVDQPAPGPYSPLVVGAPVYRSVSVVRRAEAVSAQE